MKSQCWNVAAEMRQEEGNWRTYNAKWSSCNEGVMRWSSKFRTTKNWNKSMQGYTPVYCLSHKPRCSMRLPTRLTGSDTWKLLCDTDEDESFQGHTRTTIHIQETYRLVD
ncbi:unnamed protein product [Absidia cylindrospora]